MNKSACQEGNDTLWYYTAHCLLIRTVRALVGEHV